MAEIDIGDAAMAGVRTITRQPFSVLVWGLAMGILVAALFLLFGGGIASAISAIVASGGKPGPEQVLALIGGAFGFICLLIIGVQLLDLVIRAAAIRAELHPEAHSYAYLRFGAQEGWLLATSFVFWLVLFGANLAMSIPVAIISAAATFGSIASGAQGSPDLGMTAGAIGLRLIGQLVIAAVSIWLWLRLSLGVVMTYQERQFRLFEAWSVSRGHVWRMFLVMLLVILMLTAMYIVLWIIGIVTIGVTIVGVAGHDPRAFFSQPSAAWLGALTPVFVFLLVAIMISVGVSNAMIWGAVARMWRQLNPDADAAKTFA